MHQKSIIGALLVVLLVTGHGQQVEARAQRMAAQQKAAAAAQVPPPNPNPLDTFVMPPTELPPNFTAIKLVQLGPILPLLADLNASVVATWIPVIERVPPSTFQALVPVANALNASTVEALLAALPFINMETVLELLPAINAMDPKILVAFVKLLPLINPKVVEAILPAINSLDPTWLNKVVPAVAKLDADWLARVLTAVGPVLSKVNPDQLVALLPAISMISVETIQKMIELLNKLTVGQLDLLVHLLDVTGPVLDKMVAILNTMRRALPIDASTIMGKTTVFTKPKGTVGMQPHSVVLARKHHPQSPPNNGAAPAPMPPPVPVQAIPRTLNNTRYAGEDDESLAGTLTDTSNRRLLGLFRWW